LQETKSEDLPTLKKKLNFKIRSRTSFRGDYAKVAEIQYGKFKERRRFAKIRTRNAKSIRMN
jgi:hypothetical protein